MDMFEGVGRRLDQVKGSFLDIGQHGLNGREHKCLFRNNGDGTFTEVAWVNGADRIEDGRGLSVVDYDADGQPDLVLRNYRQPAVLLHNRGGARHWIELALVGVRSNRDAVGARVRLRAGERNETRVVQAGSGFLSADSRVVHAGLGDAVRAEDVVVTWPSGDETALGTLAGDRRYVVVEGAGVVRENPVTRAAGSAHGIAVCAATQ
jgi:enediyne biosynthesis protein E4